MVGEIDTELGGRTGRPSLIAAALCGGLSALACGAELQPDATVEQSSAATWPGAVVAGPPILGGVQPSAVLLPAAPPTPTDACPGNRWVGLLERGDCKDLMGRGPGGTWQPTQLFAGRTMRAAAAAQTDPLTRFCALDWVPDQGTFSPPPKEAPLTAMPVRGLAPDCRVVSPLAPAESLHELPDVPVQLFNTFMKQTGALAGPPKGAASQVRVAVVDSAPDSASQTGKAGKGRYLHGRAIGRVVRELTCPADGNDPACIGHVSNHLALPLVPPGARDPDGGFYGSQGDLAQAIVRAVDDWQDSAIAGARKGVPLVLNLSVAWDSQRGYGGEYGSSPSELRGPAAAVHAAITRAVCLGAVVIAAAGNRSGGTPETIGPMFPAAWESKPAPSPTACRPYRANAAALGPGIDAPDPAGPRLAPAAVAFQYRPLVYAVGGVDGFDHKIAATRLRGRPRLAAMAFHVSALDRDGGGFTDVFTGTSISTAVVSAAAAAVWGYVPTLPAAQVMRIVYESGHQLAPAAPADFCLGAVCPPIRRVSVCRAARLACTLYPAACVVPPPPCAEDVPAHAGTNPRWENAVWESAVALVDRVESQVEAAPSCSGPGCAPADQHPTNVAVPWVCPQPGWPGCDVCVIEERETLPSLGAGDDPATIAAPTSTGTLYVSTYRNFAWTSAVVTIEDGNGVNSYDLTETVHPGTGKRTFVVRGFILAPPVLRATISFKHGTGPNAASTSEQLLLWGN